MLEELTLRCLLDVQVEISIRQMDLRVELREEVWAADINSKVISIDMDGI